MWDKGFSIEHILQIGVLASWARQPFRIQQLLGASKNRCKINWNNREHHEKGIMRWARALPGLISQTSRFYRNYNVLLSLHTLFIKSSDNRFRNISARSGQWKQFRSQIPQCKFQSRRIISEYPTGSIGDRHGDLCSVPLNFEVYVELCVSYMSEV